MDQQLHDILAAEEARQAGTLNLIASENYPSREVSLALTSLAGAKYAEGYPHKRYYAGCSTIDELEELAISLACELFGVKFANVQPHSGSNANLAVYHAMLAPGDNVLAPAMDSGGHLTHGAAASVTSKLWNFTHYHADGENGEYDYEQIERLAREHKPKLIVAGTSAYPKLIDWARMREIAGSVDALLLADIAHLAGLIAGGAIPSPAEHAHIMTSTTQKSLRGPRGGIILTNDRELAKKIDRAVFPGLQGGPHEHTIAAKVQCFTEALRPEFGDYARSVVANARALAKALAGLGVTLWTGTTETHLLNIDTIKSFDIDGKAAEEQLEASGIIVNREALPGDDKPLTPSGIRLGTPALTTRGMGETQMKKIAELIVAVLRDHKDISRDVANLCNLFPM